MKPTPAQEQACDDMARRGDHLRAAVAWRVYQGKAEILSAMTGVPINTIETFAETGEIDAVSRMILEGSR